MEDRQGDQEALGHSYAELARVEAQERFFGGEADAFEERLPLGFAGFVGSPGFLEEGS